MPSLHPGWRVIGLLIAGLFLTSAAGGIRRGRYDDPDGTLEGARTPVLFWLSTLGLVVMGLYLLGVALGVPALGGPSRH